MTDEGPTHRLKLCVGEHKLAEEPANGNEPHDGHRVDHAGRGQLEPPEGGQQQQLDNGEEVHLQSAHL